MGAFMFFIKVKESLVVTNYGFILGPVIGYMLDQAIGTDDGMIDLFYIHNYYDDVICFYVLFRFQGLYDSHWFWIYI